MKTALLAALLCCATLFACPAREVTLMLNTYPQYGAVRGHDEVEVYSNEVATITGGYGAMWDGIYRWQLDVIKEGITNRVSASAVPAGIRVAGPAAIRLEPAGSYDARLFVHRVSDLKRVLQPERNCRFISNLPTYTPL